MMVANLGETKGALHPQKAEYGAYCTHIEPTSSAFLLVTLVPFNRNALD